MINKFKIEMFVDISGELLGFHYFLYSVFCMLCSVACPPSIHWLYVIYFGNFVVYLSGSNFKYGSAVAKQGF